MMLLLMATLAILDEVLPAQLRERPDELAPVEVVWTGTDRELLRQSVAKSRPTILALDLDLLGDEPLFAAQQLAQEAGAELVLVLHRFARREVIREVARAGARPVKAPIRLSALRTHMTSVIVREILKDEGAPKAATPPLRMAKPPLADPNAAPRRFSQAQLGRLAEIQSSVECECPNHLSEILISLNAFEEYSRACANRDDDDARVHAMLARSTGAARVAMESALAELLVHERIVL